MKSTFKVLFYLKKGSEKKNGEVMITVHSTHSALYPQKTPAIRLSRKAIPDHNIIFMIKKIFALLLLSNFFVSTYFHNLIINKTPDIL